MAPEGSPLPARARCAAVLYPPADRHAQRARPASLSPEARLRSTLNQLRIVLARPPGQTA
jgi:hypothetical protein